MIAKHAVDDDNSDDEILSYIFSFSLMSWRHAFVVRSLLTKILVESMRRYVLIDSDVDGDCSITLTKVLSWSHFKGICVHLVGTVFASGAVTSASAVDAYNDSDDDAK
uniref:Uncharacterized protein n=1 Tax=Glossina pallidipes TaxID=7398 RepID=A0A1A9ZBZ0_GLOPL